MRYKDVQQMRKTALDLPATLSLLGGSLGYRRKNKSVTLNPAEGTARDVRIGSSLGRALGHGINAYMTERRRAELEKAMKPLEGATPEELVHLAANFPGAEDTPIYTTEDMDNSMYVPVIPPPPASIPWRLNDARKQVEANSQGNPHANTTVPNGSVKPGIFLGRGKFRAKAIAGHELGHKKDINGNPVLSGGANLLRFAGNTAAAIGSILPGNGLGPLLVHGGGVLTEAAGSEWLRRNERAASQNAVNVLQNIETPEQLQKDQAALNAAYSTYDPVQIKKTEFTPNVPKQPATPAPAPARRSVQVGGKSIALPNMRNVLNNMQQKRQ